MIMDAEQRRPVPRPGGQRIRLPALEPVPGRPAVTALRVALRAVVVSSPFRNLTELGAALRPRVDARRLSEHLKASRPSDEHTVRALLRACGTGPERQQQIDGLLAEARAEESRLAARSVPGLARRAVVASTGTDRLPRVAEFTDWERLGVHRPITHLGSGAGLSGRVDAGDLPAYVLREAERGRLRPCLREAAAGQGPPVRLIVITGESTAGKTRTAWEAMRAELSAWRLLIPRSAELLAELLDDGLDLGHLVVWLDEFHELLTQPRGVEQIDRMLDRRSGPTVLLATLRADSEQALERVPAWSRLARKDVTRVVLRRRPPQGESVAELARARELDDPRIREAVQHWAEGYGLAEWLAAGPQLVRALELARTSSDPVQQLAAALVDAAVDCHRAGYTVPVPEALLDEACRHYLPGRPGVPHGVPRVDAADLAAARQWARRPIAGATGLLVEHPGVGDRAFDYLLVSTDHGQIPAFRTLLDSFFRHAPRDRLAAIADVTVREVDYFTNLWRRADGSTDAVGWLVARICAGPSLYSISIEVELLRSGRVWEALCWQQRICERRRELEDLGSYVLDAYSLGHVTEVVRWLRVRVDCGHTDAFAPLARITLDEGRFDEAIGWFERAAAVEPNSFEGVFLQAFRSLDPEGQERYRARMQS